MISFMLFWGVSPTPENVIALHLIKTVHEAMMVRQLFLHHMVRYWHGMHIKTAIIALLLSCAPAWAGETAWQDVSPGVKLRLISSGQIATGGTTMIGLEVDMAENVKTYWRVPGETGIPTEFDFGASRGVKAHDVLWPYPQIETKSGYTDFVYYGTTVLPLRLQVEGDAPAVDVSVVMGICSDICIPVRANLQLPLDQATPDRGNALRLRQAVTDAPLAWGGRADAIGDIALTADGKAITVRLDGEIDPLSVIVSSDGGVPLFGAPQKSREPGLIELPILGQAGKKDYENQSVQITFMTDMGPFEVSRALRLFSAD